MEVFSPDGVECESLSIEQLLLLSLLWLMEVFSLDGVEFESIEQWSEDV